MKCEKYSQDLPSRVKKTHVLKIIVLQTLMQKQPMSCYLVDLLSHLWKRFYSWALKDPFMVLANVIGSAVVYTTGSVLSGSSTSILYRSFNRYNKYRWILRLKTHQNPKDPFTADEYFCWYSVDFHASCYCCHWYKRIRSNCFLN